MQKCVFLDWAGGHVALRGSSAVAAIGVDGDSLANGRRGGNVRDLLGVGVLAADLRHANVASLAGLGEGVVAAVKILALLWFLVLDTHSGVVLSA